MYIGIITIKFEPTWILSHTSNGKSTVIDDVLKSIKEDGEQNHAWVMDKAFHCCSLMITADDEPEKSEIISSLKSSVGIIDDGVKIGVEIKEIGKDAIPEYIKSHNIAVGDEDIRFLEQEFGVTLESGKQSAAETEAEPEAEKPDTEEKKTPAAGEKKKQENKDIQVDIGSLIGLDVLKRWTEEIKRLSAGYGEFVKETGVLRNTAYLISVNRGNGLSTMLRIMAQTMNEAGFFDISLTDGIKEMDFPYSDNEQEIGFYMKKIREELSMSKQYGKDCVISISIDGWMDKLFDRRLGALLNMIWEKQGNALVVFTIPYAEDSVIGQVHERIDDVINVRTLKITPPADVDYFEYFRRLLNKNGITVEDSAFAVFLEKITLEKNDGKFYGYNTVRKIADNFILGMLIDVSKSGEEIPDTIGGKELGKYYVIEADDGVSGIEQLDGMVALNEVKQKVREILSTVKLQKEMYASGGSQIKPCFHMMFTGNPGTGKTVVARIVGKIFKEAGLLSVGNFFEVSRKDFVGKYVGQTAPKTMETCRSAYGSVLFIDEAYLLADERDGYSAEAVGTLIAEMENNRDNMIVIFAGYEKELERLFDMNAGLRDRIPHKLNFPNYSREELKQIFFKQLEGKIGYGEDFAAEVDIFFKNLSDSLLNAPDFSNGRFVRNLSERIVSKAALRFDMTNADINEFKLVPADLQVAVADRDFQSLMEKKEQKRRIGFN